MQVQGADCNIRYIFFFCVLFMVILPFMQDVNQFSIFIMALPFWKQTVYFQILSFVVSHLDLETFGMNKTWPFCHLENIRISVAYNIQEKYLFTAYILWFERKTMCFYILRIYFNFPLNFRLTVIYTIRYVLRTTLFAIWGGGHLDDVCSKKGRQGLAEVYKLIVLSLLKLQGCVS